MRSLIRFVAPFALLAASADAQVVISQVYGGGGNSGATYKNDFVELFNRGNASRSLTGLSVQYASTAGSFTSLLITPLPSSSLAPGQYFLVQLYAPNSPVGASLPASDATGSTNMSASAGKVALVNSATALNCGATATPCTATQMALILDMIGYGTGANMFEGSLAPGLSNTTAAIRQGGGCIDTDNNSSDFQAATPTPR